MGSRLEEELGLPLFGYLSHSGDGAASYILTYVSRGRADLGGHAEGMDGV